MRCIFRQSGTGYKSVRAGQLLRMFLLWVIRRVCVDGWWRARWCEWLAGWFKWLVLWLADWYEWLVLWLGSWCGWRVVWLADWCEWLAVDQLLRVIDLLCGQLFDVTGLLCDQVTVWVACCVVSQLGSQLEGLLKYRRYGHY